MRSFILSLSFVALSCGFVPLAHADDDLDCQIISEAIDPTEAQATLDYVNLTDGTFGTSTTADDEFIVSRDSLVWGVRADVDVAPGAGDIWSVSIVDDGVATAVTCSISGTETSCSSASDLIRTVDAGSDLMVVVTSAAGATPPAAAAEIRFGFCVSRKR